MTVFGLHTTAAVLLVIRIPLFGLSLDLAIGTAILSPLTRNAAVIVQKSNGATDGAETSPSCIRRRKAAIVRLTAKAPTLWRSAATTKRVRQIDAVRTRAERDEKSSGTPIAARSSKTARENDGAWQVPIENGHPISADRIANK